MGSRPTAPTRFNGAAALTLRKPTRQTIHLPRMRCFNGAAALTLRKRTRRLGGVVGEQALQWGRSVNAAETRKNVTLQLHGLGFNGAAALTLRKPNPTTPRGTRPSSFNGAAALTLRKPPSRPEPPHGRRCFNGAAALTLRKLAVRATRGIETCGASMGPQR